MHEPHKPSNPRLRHKHHRRENKPFVELRSVHSRENKIRKPSIDSIAESVHNTQHDSTLFGVGGTDLAGMSVSTQFPNNGKRKGWRPSNILRPSHANRPIRHIRPEHLERKPLQAIRDTPNRQHDSREETPKGRNGHQSGSVAPAVGEDGEEDCEDELDGGLRGGDDVY